MTVKPVEMWAVECDHDGCGLSTEHISGEYAGWLQRDYAIEEWTESGGHVLLDGRAFCETHRQPVEDDPPPLTATDRAALAEAGQLTLPTEGDTTP